MNELAARDPTLALHYRPPTVGSFLSLLDTAHHGAFIGPQPRNPAIHKTPPGVRQGADNATTISLLAGWLSPPWLSQNPVFRDHHGTCVGLCHILVMLVPAVMVYEVNS